MKSKGCAVAALSALALIALARLISPTIFAGRNKGAPDAATSNDWMKSLDGTRRISQFSLPATHNSGALYEPIRGTAQCQNLSIPAQLGAGVRFLDIRCRHQNDAFYIYHGPIYQRENFADVIGYCRDFLRAHQSETVILSVKEEYAAQNNTRSFEAIFENYAARNPATWLLGSTIPTLNQARGKIILLRRFRSTKPLGIDASNWPDNQTFETKNLRVQDIYKVTDAADKWNAIESLLSQTRQNAAPANAATPLTVNFSSGVKSGWFGIPNIPAVADEINPRLSQFFAANSRGNFGVIVMDFADAEKCAAIYRTNE